jgi:catechol 2,3-dioxygenase-like lactoylglutathione lyase family enzyme
VRPHVAIIGLGVKDFARAKKFYSEGLGWPIQQEEGEWVSFILGDGSTGLTLFGWDDKAADAGVPPEGSGFRGVSLGYNVRSRERVDEVLAEAERAGGTITRPPEHTFWGGYSGSFSDPEGHLWEVQTGATQLPFSE